MTPTTIGVNVDAAFDAAAAAAGNPYWKARADKIVEARPQIVRCGTRDKAMLDLCAKAGATLWPGFTQGDSVATVVAWLKQDHPANARAYSRDNEPWFRKPPVQGDAWARACQPVYEQIREQVPDAWLACPVIFDHSGTPQFAAKFLATWPDAVKVLDAFDIHPYSNKTDPLADVYPGSRWQYEQLRELLDAHGGQHIVFDATEQDWSTHGSGPNAYDVVTEATQAAWSAKLFDYEIARGDVHTAMAYALTDTYKASDNENEQRHFGRYRQTADGGPLTQKPSLAVLISRAEQQRKAGAPNVFYGGGAPPTPPPPPPAEIGGGDIRYIAQRVANALDQDCTVRRTADGADGRKALTWSTAAGDDVLRIRATDLEWINLLELLGLGS
jgi:hypothetical protein